MAPLDLPLKKDIAATLVGQAVAAWAADELWAALVGREERR